MEQSSPTSGQLPGSRQLQGGSAEDRLTLDSYWMILHELYIVVLAIIFTLNVPAPLRCQYENTPLRGVCFLLGGEKDLLRICMCDV